MSSDLDARASRITEIVLRYLTDITLIPAERIRRDDQIVKDLKAAGDDLSFVLAPGIEKELGVSLSDDEWQRMRTVGDVIAAFELALQSRDRTLSNP